MLLAFNENNDKRNPGDKTPPFNLIFLSYVRIHFYRKTNKQNIKKNRAVYRCCNASIFSIVLIYTFASFSATKIPLVFFPAQLRTKRLCGFVFSSRLHQYDCKI